MPTRARLLSAARELVARGDGPLPSAGAVARHAGVSRLTVYHHFGSIGGLMSALVSAAAPPAAADGPELRPVEALRLAILSACEHWAAEPALYRRLPAAAGAGYGAAGHELALALANADELRPGCSLREAEDVIALLTSFAPFDRLHQDGRRSSAAVGAILFRLAGGVLKQAPS